MLTIDPVMATFQGVMVYRFFAGLSIGRLLPSITMAWPDVFGGTAFWSVSISHV
jgi:hypothetical protein